ncbi:hypothetical protein RCL1_007946 [Eukaryota sp. TZLM3-RCL]
MIKGSISSSAPLRLTDVQAETVSSFLKEHSAYVRSVGAENALSKRDCIDESLLSCFTLLRPLIKKSDSDLKKYLESLIGYSSIEEVYLAFDCLVMDNSIPDPQARVFKLLQDFMDVQRRSKDFDIPEASLLSRFAKAVKPAGLSQSLLTRVSDGLLSSLPSLVESLLEDLISLQRVSSWKRSSSNLTTSEPPIKKLDRGKVFKERLCFKCNEACHLANACPHRNKVESIRLLDVVDRTPSFLTNPLNGKKECYR